MEGSPFSVFVFLKWGPVVLPRLALNVQTSCFSLPSSQDYRYALLHLVPGPNTFSFSTSFLFIDLLIV